MDELNNPYAPGAGRPPMALTGRDHERGKWSVARQRLERDRGVRSLCLYGLRGVGKTVLLGGFAREAETAGWIVARVEAVAGEPLRGLLADALQAPLADLARPGSGVRFLRALKTALSFRASVDPTGSWSFGIDLANASGGGADSGTLDLDLAKVIRDVADGAEERGIGLAILIDEAQDLKPDELAALCTALHRASQDGTRVLVALGGLPSLPRILSEAKSYSERLFEYLPIGPLEPEAAISAILDPAATEGVDWDEGAVRYLAANTDGYPYFIQQFAYDTWSLAEESPIDLADARAGAERGRAALDSGFFRARWDRATTAEKHYLRAMAQDGDAGSLSAAVAGRLGRSPTSFGPARASLISKGLIYAPEHGRVAFTVPLMSVFINRQPT